MSAESDFVVTWVINVDAEGPVDAARTALDMMRDDCSIGAVFEVTDKGGHVFEVDLNDDDPVAVEK